VSVFGDISTDNVTKFLGIAGESVIKDFLDLIKSKDRDAVFQKIDEIHNQ
jgi:DNA polymerase III gamma/tau subunit